MPLAYRPATWATRTGAPGRPATSASTGRRSAASPAGSGGRPGSGTPVPRRPGRRPGCSAIGRSLAASCSAGMTMPVRRPAGRCRPARRRSRPPPPRPAVTTAAAPRSRGPAGPGGQARARPAPPRRSRPGTSSGRSAGPAGRDRRSRRRAGSCRWQLVGRISAHPLVSLNPVCDDTITRQERAERGHRRGEPAGEEGPDREPGGAERGHGRGADRHPPPRRRARRPPGGRRRANMTPTKTR